MARLPESIYQILADKDRLKATPSGSSQILYGETHEEHERKKADPNHNHLTAISHAWLSRGLTVSDCNRPWAPLFWFVQFRSWYYVHNPENSAKTQNRLFVGSIKSPFGKILEVWACGISDLQFFSGPGPSAGLLKMDTYNRRLTKWYHPLNEFFNLGRMPHEDPTKYPGSETPEQKLWYLSNADAGWGIRQDNYIKALICVLEAYPGLIMTRASNQIVWTKDVQVYTGLPKFPFVDEEVDSGQPDLATLLKQKSSQVKSSAPDSESTPAKPKSTPASIKSTPADRKRVHPKFKPSPANKDRSTKTS